jgi:hypothetical protein
MKMLKPGMFFAGVTVGEQGFDDIDKLFRGAGEF